MNTTPSQGQVVSLLAYATFVANMLTTGGLTLKVGREPKAFGEFSDSNPTNPVSASTHRMAKIAVSNAAARGLVRDRVEAGFNGILGFVSIEPRPTPRFYLEAFDTRDNSARGSDTALRSLSLSVPIKIGLFGKIQAARTSVDIGPADEPWEPGTLG